MVFRRCLARDASGAGLQYESGSDGTTWDRGVLWRNLYGLQTRGGSVSMGNSVIAALSALVARVATRKVVVDDVVVPAGML